MAIPRPARLAARTLFAILNNLYCVPAYVAWMLALRPLRPLFTALYWKIEGLLFHWLLAMVAMWSWTAGYEIVETGDVPAACCGARTLVLANHQSTADVPVLMAAWNPRAGVLPNIMWIMDRVFKFTNFGVVSVLHEDFFIQAGRAKRDESLEALRRHIHDIYVPLGRQFMVLFPEGGFLHKRKEVSQRFAQKNNLPLLEYVSIPRAGALKVIMDEVGPSQPRPSHDGNNKDDGNCSHTAQDSLAHSAAKVANADRLKWVLDVTIAYADREPLGLAAIVSGSREPCATHLYYRLYPATDIPHDHEEMTQWLYDRFIEKESILEEFYRTGKFPAKGPDGIVRDTSLRPVRQDNLRFFIVHAFYIASTLLQLKVLWSALQMCLQHLPW